jgi:uncharacterized membrane protein YheB (UPF0754 family)
MAGVDFYQNINMDFWILSLPFLSALSAWIIVTLAARFLVYRIIPKRQAILADKIGNTIASHFSLAPIEQKISDPGNVKKIMPMVEAHVDDFLRNKLKEKMPMIGMLIGDKTINSLKEVFLREIEEMFPQVLSKFAGNLQADLNISSMVSSKIRAIPAAQISTALSPLVTYFTLVAIAIGFLIGVINLVILSVFG